ncbi:MAG: hypothetical protein H7644_06850, partial [Candidatus Heimdallarchaeota archaeon]|nr:hypothetical protein [Candidatus Heimdallarchaeota archaeon]MCK5143467.1 hypothetical protein [Candidatus Heimdallarchaeota archaeon]
SKKLASSNRTPKEPRYKLYLIIGSCITVVSIIILSLTGPQIICDSMNCLAYVGFGGLLLIPSMISNITLGRRLYLKRRVSLGIQKSNHDF